MQEFLDAARAVGNEHAVTRARLRRNLDGNARRLAALQIDLQCVEQQQHVAAHDEHPAGNAPRHHGRGHAEFIKERRCAAARKRPRHARKQLAACGKLRSALAVAARVQHKNALISERPLAALAARDFAQHIQRRAAASDTLAAGIGDDKAARLPRQAPVAPAALNLRAVRGRLRLICSGDDQVIPRARLFARHGVGKNLLAVAQAFLEKQHPDIFRHSRLLICIKYRLRSFYHAGAGVSNRTGKARHAKKIFVWTRSEIDKFFLMLNNNSIAESGGALWIQRN